MAKKKSRRARQRNRTALRSRKSIRRPKSAPAESPVTLAQARALAKERAPAARGAKVALVATSPASVGLERRKLELKQAQERRRRIKEYKTTLAIMKKRGVKGLAPPTVKAVRTPKDGREASAGVCRRRLVVRLSRAILRRRNHSPARGEARGPDPESGEGGRRSALHARRERAPAADRTVHQRLSRGRPLGRDAVLRGGNDSSTIPWRCGSRTTTRAYPRPALIHQGRARCRPRARAAGYEDLIGLRDSLSPNTRLFFHGYDFAIPDGRGICHLGPWLKPTFDLRGFPTQASAFGVTKILARAVRRDASVARVVARRSDDHQQPGDAGSPAGLLAQRAASVERRVQGLCETVARLVEGGIPKPCPVAAPRRREL